MDNFDRDPVQTGEELRARLIGRRLLAEPLDTNASRNCSGMIELARTIREEAARSPSAGLGMVMHAHVVVACDRFQDLVPLAGRLLADVARGSTVVASAFAEGVPGQHVFKPNVTWHARQGSIRLQGTKRPCTLGSVADYYAVSCHSADDPADMRLAIVSPKAKPRFDDTLWRAPYLRGADTGAVTFDDLLLDEEALSLPDEAGRDALLAYGIAVFSLLVSANYAGVMDRVIAEMDEAARPGWAGTDARRFAHAADRTIVDMAKMIDILCADFTRLPDVMLMRYEFERHLRDFAGLVESRMGGLNYILHPHILQLLNITKLCPFHPISAHQFYAMEAAS